MSKAKPRPSKLPSSPQVQGTIDKLYDDLGIGFIKLKDGTDDELFVMINKIDNAVVAKGVGCHVWCEVVPNLKRPGKNMAINVKLDTEVEQQTDVVTPPAGAVVC